MLSTKHCKFANELDDLERDSLRKHDDRVILNRALREPARKPGRKFAAKHRFRHCFIDYARARIESGLHAVAMDNGLAKTMDCRGGQFVKSRCRCRKCRLLRRAEAGRKHGLDEIGYAARQKLLYGFPDAVS